MKIEKKIKSWQLVMVDLLCFDILIEFDKLLTDADLWNCWMNPPAAVWFGFQHQLSADLTAKF